MLVNTAAAGPFSQLVVFGDSLADVGNIAASSLDIFPGRYYHDDRFSNGPVFVEALSVGLGLGPSIRSTAGGNNFAYGGAQTAGTGGLQGLVIRDIDEQVDQFLATRTVDPGALFLVFAGSNDLVNGQTNAHVPVNSLAADIGRLVAAGARNFLVPNLALLGHTPRFNNNPSSLAQYNTRTMQFNDALDMSLNDLEAMHATLNLFRLDVEAMFNEALAHPAKFSLANVIDAAAPGLEPGDSSYNTNQIAANAHEYLFWDDLHPTTTVHAILAQRALALFDLPGDFNRDGVLDTADYVVWRNELGTTYTAADFNSWRTNFGRKNGDTPDLSTVANPRASRAVVPEPAACALLLACGILAANISRYRRLLPARSSVAATRWR
jgi:phospholipase/lecithinase/hemolysin